MERSALTYHQRVAGEKRASILAAATRLFSDGGYDGTSLARVAEDAGVSTATLFKQFPTKASLFQAIVEEFWGRNGALLPTLNPEQPRSGLVKLGREYADLLLRPGMAGLHRMVIAEAPRFPELAQIQFDLGKEPFFTRVYAYISSADEMASLRVPDVTSAATQFLGMISNVVFWPKLLLVDWNPTRQQIDETILGATDVMIAAYGADPMGGAD
jgi:TetR/AcrR family transcriptional regulator, regulator of autoinduction and epiphytic fitness